VTGDGNDNEDGMEENLRFPSKVDWWLPVLLGVVLMSAPVSLALGARHTPFTPATLAIVIAS
jgi:hypothetical protein